MDFLNNLKQMDSRRPSKEEQVQSADNNGVAVVNGSTKLAQGSQEAQNESSSGEVAQFEESSEDQYESPRFEAAMELLRAEVDGDSGQELDDADIMEMVAAIIRQDMDRQEFVDGTVEQIKLYYKEE